MKKFFAVLLVLTLLLAVSVQAWAAGSASFSGPDLVRAGDTITLRFSAGGGIYGGNGSVSFDSSQLTLVGYEVSIGSPWLVEFSGNSFVFYDNSMTSPITDTKTIFKATFQVSSSLQPGTNVAVSVNGLTLSDGASDTAVGTKTYSVTIAEPPSSNANLKSLTVANAEISPAFNPATTSYTASVPFTTKNLEVAAEAEHPRAEVTVGKTALTAGGTTDVTVTVKAEDGTTQVYHIKTKRAQDPNYVPSGENSLSSLAVEGFQLSPAFDPACTAYAVTVPNETASLQVSAKAKDAKAKVAMPAFTEIPVGETAYEIPVTAENGNVRVYTLTVTREGILPPETEPTVTETEPVTEPTTEATTEPATEATTEPTQATTVPQEIPEGKGPTLGVDFWLWILVVIMAYCAGCITILLIPGARRK